MRLNNKALTSSELKNDVTLEQIRILISHKTGITWGTAAVGLLTTAALWTTASTAGLLVWLFLSFVLSFIRWHLFSAYEKKSEGDQFLQRRYWGNVFTVFSVINGLFWGSLTFLFFPEEHYYLALLLGLHACYISAAASSTSIYLPTFYGFIVTSSVVFFTGFLVMGGLEFWPHAILIAIYGAAIVVLGLRNNRSLTQQILLRIENASLMEELVGQRDRAESAMLGKNRFLAAASHDLRQPVHALGLYVDSLEKHQSSEESRRILGKIRQSTAALAGLFHGLLDISKLDANVIENEPEHFNLDGLLSVIQTDFQNTAAQKGLNFYVDSKTGVALYADEGLLNRILRNLVSNALNYTDVGSVSVTVEPEEPAGYFKIAVSDTGRGIPPEEHANIFSEYHQLENPERDRQKGLGLGLAIVRRLCSLMEIPIRVQSVPGEGSCFTINVKGGELGFHGSEAGPDEIRELSGYRIVVIDDELDILDGMQEILSGWGCKVSTAESTESAKLAVRSFGSPDLIIADFRLRGDDSGLSTIEMIRDEFNMEIPALLITGDTAPGRLREAANASVEVMHKPVEPARLKAAIASITKNRHSAENI